MLNQKFCHLHCHSDYSILDGCGTISKYIDKAKEMEFNYLALTDHGNVDGVIEFQKICKENNISPIIGCELYIVPNALVKEKGEKRGHIVVLVKNDMGWKNLLQMLTYANLEGFYRRPRVDYDIILNHSDGLIFLTGCILSFLTLKNGEKFLQDLINIRKNDIFFEIMPHNDPDKLQLKHNKLCKKLSIKYNIPLVATNDTHYITNKDVKSQEVLLAVQTKKKWNDPDRWKFSFDKLFLRSANEMIKEFLKQKIFSKQEIIKSLNNTIKIAQKCSDFEIKKLNVYLPQIKQCNNMNEKEEIIFLRKLCRKGFNKKVIQKNIKNINEYKKRFKYEFELIIKLNFIRYFLIVWELINWCKSNDIMCGCGRGSVGASLIAYLLDITSVDPIKHDLLFSRFINENRIDLPDIDIDFEDMKRGKIRKHLEEMYGKNHVAGVSTFSKMKGRGAIRDVSRVFNIPLSEVDIAAKSIVTKLDGDMGFNETIKDSFEQFEEGKKFKKKYPEITNIAMNLEGQIRSKSSHAAAMIVSKDDLKNGERTNLQYDKKNKEYVINWDKENAEYVGLMKLDILGLNALTIMNETRKLIEKNKKIKIDFEEISLNDKKILQEFSSGNTIGIFQFGSLGLRKLCRELAISNFKELTDANALFRPGTLRSGLVNEYIEYKNNTINLRNDYNNEILKNLTKDTYGIILYQEQIMLLIHELAGLEWNIADKVRKIIGKSRGEEQFLKFKNIFIEGCKKNNTLDSEEAGELWEKLASFSQYSFNKAHAVEYSMMAYWQMFLKLYYPAEFLTCSLTYGQDDKKEELIEEIKRIGLKIQLPKIDISDIKKWKVKNNILYIPFLEIKGIGEKTSQKIIKKNHGFFKTEEKIKLNKNIEELLKNIKAYDSDYELTEDEKDKVKHYFSFEISNDPIKKYENILELLKNNIDIMNLYNIDWNNSKGGYYFGKILNVNFKDKDGSKIIYGTIKDETDYCSIIFNDKLYNSKKNIIEHLDNTYCLVKGYPSNKSNMIICNNIWNSENLLNCNFDDIDLNLINFKRFNNKNLLTCKNCELCKNPIMPSRGRYNLMIVGEAPGDNENLNGIGFIGKAGQILWRNLEKYNLYRKIFHITNIVKCWPGKGNPTPTIENIRKCSKWLNEELEKLKPILVLALGNVPLQFFKGKKSGITNLNGTTEWNSKYNCWVCYCIHPAMLLYGREEAKKLLDIGLNNFNQKIKILGDIYYD